MALTPDEIRQSIISKIDVSKEPNWSDQNDVCMYRGLHVKHDYQLETLKKMYKAKVPKLVQVYEENLTEIARYIKNFDIPKAELKEDFEGMKSKVLRLAEKWLATKREIEGRKKGYFVRKPIGTVYYIDLDNGTDGPGGTVHDGLKEDNGGADYTATAGTDATHAYIAKGDLDNNGDDEYNGDYLYNVTRSAGALISDYDAADNGNSIITHGNIANQVATDKFFIIRAWKTLAQYTTITGRNAGDIAYVRANTSETRGSDIFLDEDGDQDDYIEIVGCDSVTNDPWGDGSDVKPILTFGDGNFQILASGDDFWKITRLIIKESADLGGNIYFNNCDNWYFLDCEFTDNSNANGGGAGHIDSTNIFYENCVYKDNLGFNVKTNRSLVKFKNGTFDGGAETTLYGITALRLSCTECIDCDFGQTTDHDIADINADNGSKFYLRNCNTGVAGINIVNWSSVIFEEDTDATFEAQAATYYQGVVTRDTGVTRVGGADSSAKMLPTIRCGVNNPLTLNNGSIVDSAFKIWVAAALTTITIYIRAVGTWGTYPTAPELYIEARYLDHAVNATRTAVQSNDVLNHASDWKAFDVTFTPQQVGWVYIDLYFGIYEDAGDGCYVDIKPVVS